MVPQSAPEMLKWSPGMLKWKHRASLWQPREAKRGRRQRAQPLSYEFTQHNHGLGHAPDPAAPPSPVKSTAAQDAPATRARGQDDGSSTKLPHIVCAFSLYFMRCHNNSLQLKRLLLICIDVHKNDIVTKLIGGNYRSCVCVCKMVHLYELVKTVLC